MSSTKVSDDEVDSFTKVVDDDEADSFPKVADDRLPGGEGGLSGAVSLSESVDELSWRLAGGRLPFFLPSS